MNWTDDLVLFFITAEKCVLKQIHFPIGLPLSFWQRQVEVKGKTIAGAGLSVLKQEIYKKLKSMIFTP